ncbi:MAG TPA: bacterial transcriptional activator domain-containing protein, partial [Longimicrobium sp.]|nr:bacterial transcriptional activator domain-containing protein [Longimicrobium sp.]
EEFSSWADARRAELRRAAVRWLDRAGERAEREQEWARALRLGERSVQIDREWEGGHRRVMRALLERGERNLALRHFREFARWLTYEIGGHPDPETVALADLIRASATLPFPAPTPAREPAPPPTVLAAADEHEAEASPAAAEPAPHHEPVAAPPAAAVGGGDSPDVAAGSPAPAEASPPPEPAPARAAALEQADAGAGVALVVGVVAVLVVLTVGLWALGARPWDRRDPDLVVERGEVIQAKGDPTAYMVFGHALYGFPDHATLNRCLGSFPRIRQVRLLPPGPKRMLPSVRKNRWLGETDAVIANDPTLLVQYVSVGCVLAPVPDPATFTSIFGHTNWAASARASDPLLQRLPRVAEAGPFPVRPAATLIQGPGGTIRWITYHGGALTVPSMHVLATYCRTRGDAVRVSPEEFRYYQSYADLPPSSIPCGWEHIRRETPIATQSARTPEENQSAHGFYIR